MLTRECVALIYKAVMLLIGKFISVLLFAIVAALTYVALGTCWVLSFKLILWRELGSVFYLSAYTTLCALHRTCVAPCHSVVA